MSRRMKRFVLSVLISVAVLAGVYTSVLGASAKRGEVHVNVNAMFNTSHPRHVVQKLEIYSSQQAEKSGRHCDEGGSDPSDY